MSYRLIGKDDNHVCHTCHNLSIGDCVGVVSSTFMPASRRGRRNPETSKLKASEWVKSGGLTKVEAIIHSKTSEHDSMLVPTNSKFLSARDTVEEYPGHFVGGPMNAAKVTETIQNLYPGLITRDLPSVTTIGRFYIPTPIKRHALHPPYLIARFDQVVKQSVNERLIAAWDNLLQAGIRFPKPHLSRSSTPALHLGIWEAYSKQPFVTSDSRAQSSDVIVAMDKFLYLIRQLIAPKLLNLLKRDYPQQYERQMRCV